MAIPTSRGVPSLGWVCRRRSGAGSTATMTPPSSRIDWAISGVMKSMPATSSPTTRAAWRAIATVSGWISVGAVDRDATIAVVGTQLRVRGWRTRRPRPCCADPASLWRRRHLFRHRHHLIPHDQDAVARARRGARDDHLAGVPLARGTREGRPDGSLGFEGETGPRMLSARRSP